MRRILRFTIHDHIPLDEISILYRTNAQSRVFEEALQREGIAYRIYGGLSFYQRKEVKDLMAYLRLAVNPADDEAFRRVVNYPTRGIGQTTMGRLQNGAAIAGVSLWEAASNVEKYVPELGAAPRRKLEMFAALIKSYTELVSTMTASDCVGHILKSSGMAADLAASKDIEAESRRENVEELVGAVASFEKDKIEENDYRIKFVSLGEYLSTVSLLSETDEADSDTPRVTLMTVHAAKGLEFEVVFVTGMEDELFPGNNALVYPKEMEEERRLFYVAVTRAKRHCVLSYTEARFRYGSMQFPQPSIFLSEIDDRFVEREDGVGRVNRKYIEDAPAKSYTQQATYPRRSFINMRSIERATSFPTSSTKGNANHSLYVSGQQISHERFGDGVILNVEGEGQSEKIRVRFDSCGEKLLLVKFAKIQIK